MKTVKVNRAHLQSKVVQNRENHARTYQRAMSVYREEAIAELKKHLSRAEAGGKIENCLGLQQPLHYLGEYDRVIAMLDMSVDDEIELTSQEFSQYVLDKWSWQELFSATTAGYAAKFKG